GVQITGQPGLCRASQRRTFVKTRRLSNTSAGHPLMTPDNFKLGWRRPAILAALLASACASPDDEPVPQQQGPQLVITNPAIIEQDTVITGQGATFYVQGNYFTQVYANPVITVTAKEDGGPLRPFSSLQAAEHQFGWYYQPLASVRRARVEALLTDKYTQVSGQGFWLRVVPMPAPAISFAVPLPAYSAPGQLVPVRARITSTIDPPTELRLYRYELRPDGRFGLVLLSTVGEAALLAARQSGTSVVDMAPVAVPADAAPGSYTTLLLFGRTRHRMQAQLFGSFRTNF
ncbi:MAG: hypothetical protein M3Y54_19395, partial [Bacteroidota bacterium]|nr:hypothetical protein [Bacteroidota bacterium]